MLDVAQPMPDYRTDDWINAEGTIGAKKAFVRKNASLQEVSKADFPYVLMVNLAYANATPDGLPADEGELAALGHTEEGIADRLQSQFGARFGLVVTGEATRDLFFFLPTAPDEKELETAIISSEPTVYWDFAIRHDPAWQPYIRFLSELPSS